MNCNCVLKSKLSIGLHFKKVCEKDNICLSIISCLINFLLHLSYPFLSFFYLLFEPFHLLSPVFIPYLFYVLSLTMSHFSLPHAFFVLPFPCFSASLLLIFFRGVGEQV